MISLTGFFILPRALGQVDGKHSLLYSAWMASTCSGHGKAAAERGENSPRVNLPSSFFLFCVRRGYGQVILHLDFEISLVHSRCGEFDMKALRVSMMLTAGTERKRLRRSSSVKKSLKKSPRPSGNRVTVPIGLLRNLISVMAIDFSFGDPIRQRRTKPFVRSNPYNKSKCRLF